MRDEGGGRGALQVLINIATSKEQNMRSIRDITREQASLIAEGNMEALFESIEKRDFHMKAIDKLDREFGALYPEIQEMYESGRLDRVETSLYRELQATLKEIHIILNEANKQDMANMDMLKKMQKEYAEGIKKVQRGAKGQEAYRSRVPIDGGIFIDEKQ